MDPNATWKTMQELATRIQERVDRLTDEAWNVQDRNAHMDDAEELAGLVLGLAEWTDRGGFVPEAIKR